MKCKDCNSTLCSYRTSDAEKDCFYESHLNYPIPRDLRNNDNTNWQALRNQAAIAAMQGIMNFFGSIDYNRETIAKLAVEQKPAEWSEEDENRLSDAVFFVREYQIPTRDKRLLNAAKEAEEWLKSLRPKSQWEPSDGQLECLGYAIDKAEKDWSPLTNNRIYLTLKALKEQLLELRGSKV